MFIVFQLIPLGTTIYNSFFEHYFKNGLTEIGPKFVGLANFKTLFSSGDILVYFKNTMIMWIMGFVPQIIVSLALAARFSDPSLRLKGRKFFQSVIYMPNLIMASAFAMLFFALFADTGPINAMLLQSGILKTPYKFLSHVSSARTLVAFMNFLMWFGNTTILLVAGMLGIDQSLYEAAEVDGATSTQIFFRITLPILIATLRSADFLKFDMAQVYMFIFMAILPVIVVYLFMARSIVAGMTAGAVKG